MNQLDLLLINTHALSVQTVTPSQQVLFPHSLLITSSSFSPLAPIIIIGRKTDMSGCSAQIRPELTLFCFDIFFYIFYTQRGTADMKDKRTGDIFNDPLDPYFV